MKKRLKWTQNEVKMFTFKNLSPITVKLLFTIINSTGKTIHKKCWITLEISNRRWLSSIKTHHPKKLFLNWKQHSAIIRQVNVSFVSKRLHIKLSNLLSPLTNLTILTEINYNYLLVTEMRTQASQFFPGSWFFNYFGCHLFY